MALSFTHLHTHQWRPQTGQLIGEQFGVKGPVQSKSMFISIDQLPKIIEFHTIIVHNYSSVDFILIFFDTSAAILKNLKLY